MPNSLRSKLSSLRYKGKITEEEYKELIAKLDGHDKALRASWIPVSENAANLCNRCNNERCIMQSGICRNNCDFFIAKGSGDKA